ncbi:MAG: 4-(cytidine 5'-diphospho)-2-C-methyl-D-erythritol kinase [Deferribacteres bacterium]|nr:4-(cytidine 5'-diphospho)-2-C-methyl-D-erythritol kinase [Deferribacteres bacterium]
MPRDPEPYLIQKITLYDTLTFAPAENLVLQTEAPIPTEENLVYKAAALLKSRYGIREGALIHLDKNIPAGAGLGGGSSDAAAALAGLNELWSLNLSAEALRRAAAILGSDIPFFLHGPLSFVSGRGENIIPCKAEKTLDILLVKPSFDVSTAWAYENFSKLTKKSGKVDNIEFTIRSIERAELDGITGNLSNDLETVTVESFPVIAGIKERLVREGALFSLMSGSGPTVFGVFESRSRAEKAAGAFDGFWTAVVQTVAG